MQEISEDTIIAELFFSFRAAKRLLEIDHPTCGCGKKSVGVRMQWTIEKSVVGICEEHWHTLPDPIIGDYRVRFDYLEDAEQLERLKEEAVNMTFGKCLRQLRKEAGLTQRDLAAKVDTDFSYISKLENGQMPPPSMQLLERLTEVLEDEERILINHAGKVPLGLEEAMSGNPLLTELVHLLSVKKLPDEVYRQLLQIAHDYGEQA